MEAIALCVCTIWLCAEIGQFSKRSKIDDLSGGSCEVSAETRPPPPVVVWGRPPTGYNIYNAHQLYSSCALHRRRRDGANCADLMSVEFAHEAVSHAHDARRPQYFHPIHPGCWATNLDRFSKSEVTWRPLLVLRV